MFLVIVCDSIVSDSGTAAAAVVVVILPGFGIALVHSLVSHHSYSLVHWF